MPQYAPETAGGEFARSREAYAQAEGWLAGPQATGLGHAELEEQLQARIRELARQLLQDHLDVRAAREQRRARVAGADGRPRLRAERGHSRQLATVFGQVTVRRIAYRAPGAPNVHPADAQLSLPAGKHSHGLAMRLAIDAARGSFGAACAAVARATGVTVGKRQAQQVIRRAAADFGAFYRDRPLPGAAPGTVLGLSCDGKGIVMLPDQLRRKAIRKARKGSHKQEGRLSRGEVRSHKRMAEVGAVFDIVPVPRTAASIMHPAPGNARAAPAAANKWVTASVTSTAAAVVASVFAEADRRDPGHARTWIALADGNVHQLDRIRAEAAARNVTVTIICDFIHVLEYLWTAAWSFFDQASPQAGPWVRGHATAILGGHATSVAAALRAAAAPLPAARRKAADKTAGYLDAKAPYLDYPTALAAGWPISSGVIEGTCRYLVKDRMDITGARWGVATAEAVLQIRALLANGDFDAYWNYHLQREHHRNHPRPYDLAA